MAIVEMNNIENNCIEFLFSQSLIAACVIQDNRIVLSNDNFDKLYGQDARGISLEKLVERVHPNQRKFSKMQSCLTQRGLKGAITPYKYKVYNKNNEEIIIEVFSKTVKYHGKLASLIICNEIENLDKSLYKLDELETSVEKFLDFIRNNFKVMCNEINIVETPKTSINEMLLCNYDIKTKDLFKKRGIKHKHIKILSIENLS